MLFNYPGASISNKMFVSIGLASLLSLIFLLSISRSGTNSIDVSGQAPYEIHIQVGASDPRTPMPYSPPVLPFEPGIVAPVGVAVTWINDDQTFHTVTSGDPLTGPDTRFDSGILSPHQTYSWTFTTPGTFGYFCTIHPFMRGEVRVG
jgi:hypothetical protein